MTSHIHENKLIESLTKGFLRSPRQYNRIQETDAEIIQVSNSLLAITIDSIAEEIASGLYNDPYLSGWMAVIANVSDLAAVGAKPIGLVISEIIPPNYPEHKLMELQRGIADASASCGAFILGGDTNAGPQLTLTGCAIGQLPAGKFLSRVGCQPGDILYVTNKLGNGNAFALSQLAFHFPEVGEAMGEKRVTYRPQARVIEGQSLLGIASGCMDTSDGVLSTIDQLMRLNHVGIQLRQGWEELLSREALSILERTNIPAWLLLAGQHGEFELLFTISPERSDELHTTARQNGWTPLELGVVSKDESIVIPLYGNNVEIDTGWIRNLPVLTDGSIERYVIELMNYDNKIQTGVCHDYCR